MFIYFKQSESSGFSICVNVYNVYLFDVRPNSTWKIKTKHLYELPLKMHKLVKKDNDEFATRKL